MILAYDDARYALVQPSDGALLAEYELPGKATAIDVALDTGYLHRL